MYHTLDVDLGLRIRWALDPNDPQIVWSDDESIGIINPLVHQAIRLKARTEITSRPQIVFGSTTTLITDCLGVVMPEPANMLEWLGRDLPLLLNALRLTSGQYALKHGSTSTGRITVEEFPTVDWPSCDQAKAFQAPTMLSAAAISAGDAKQALRIFSNGGMHAGKTILLDCIEGYYQQDYRRAIIYSAIAMESIAATVLDLEMDALQLTQTQTAGRWRFVPTTVSNNNITLVDPVYRALRESDKFAPLLHAIPLYVRGRSILLEDKPLHDMARMVYSTRNDIVHRAEVRDGGSGTRLSIDACGAEQAVQCALKVCAWFGEGTRFFFGPLSVSTYEGTEI